jgi:hypothetical protein
VEAFILNKPILMKKQMRVGVKAASIGGICVIVAAILTALLTNSSFEKSQIQKVDSQKVDTGSISNYNAGRDLKIENNTYNGVIQNADSIKSLGAVEKHIKAPITKLINQKTNIHEQTNVTSNNQSGGQTAKEIINNNN